MRATNLPTQHWYSPRLRLQIWKAGRQPAWPRSWTFADQSPIPPLGAGKPPILQIRRLWTTRSPHYARRARITYSGKITRSTVDGRDSMDGNHKQGFRLTILNSYIALIHCIILLFVGKQNTCVVTFSVTSTMKIFRLCYVRFQANALMMTTIYLWWWPMICPIDGGVLRTGCCATVALLPQKFFLTLALKKKFS